MVFLKGFWLVSLLVCLGYSGLSATQVDPEPVTIPGAVVHSLESEIIQEGFRLYVGFPRDFRSDPGHRYPVLYALDADYAFASLVEMSRLLAFSGEAVPLIVVGIGYEPGADFIALRGRDFTPTVVPGPNPEDSASPGTGGAPLLLKALREEILPFIESRYPIDEGNRGFFGDSFGGLFGLYTLFHQPETFRRYVLGSPSIWWDSGVTFEFEERYAGAHGDLPVALTLSVGTLEEDPSDPRSAESAMVSNVQKLTERLRSRGYPSMELHTRLIEGETHISAVPNNFSWGLRVLFSPGGG